LKKKQRYLLSQLENNNRIWGISGVGESSWIRIFEILRDRIKADIDVVVSIDLHRLIRMAGSLHGKTGFRVIRVPFDKLEAFDPFQDALSFPYSPNNTLNIQITVPRAPTIRIGDKEFGPYIQGEKVEVPLNTALFLLSKNVAELIKK
jgi:DNA primase small subunit